MTETGWIHVTYKKPYKTPKPKFHYYEKYIEPKDYTLTKEEEKLVECSDCSSKCVCCNYNIISDIIQRTVVPCGFCYCCVGDNPAFDDENTLRIIENRIIQIKVYNK